MFFVSDFLNFFIKENMFCGLDYAFERFPIFQISCCPVLVQSTIIIVIPPAFGMFRNSNFFSIHLPYNFDS